jgi:sugar phosphate isomerase/epimerase
MRAATVDTNGVDLGAITYSFRALPNAQAVLDAMARMRFTQVELMYNDAEQLLGAPKEPPDRMGRTAAQLETDDRTRAELSAWREKIDAARFAEVTALFGRAGIVVRVLCHNFDVRASDQRIDYAFRMAKGLGVSAMSTTTRVSVAPRLAPFADRYRITVGFHNHDWADRPDEFATPESFDKALALSRYHGVNLDIGHFVAAGYDPVAYITSHHDRITNLHIKDRKSNHGAVVPFGQGAVPIAGVLQLLKKNAWKIPASIEFEYDGDPLVEVPKCLEFCQKALA